MSLVVKSLSGAFVDFDEPVADSITVPSAPQNVNVVTAYYINATVSWEPPVDTGGAVISGYNVEILNSSSTVIDSTSVDASTLTATFTVAASSSYTASVTARNRDGDGDAATFAFTTGSAGTSGWDPSADGVFDSVTSSGRPLVGYYGDPDTMTPIAKGDVLNGATLGAAPLVGPGKPLYTSLDANGNPLLEHVKLDPSFNYITGSGSANAGSPGFTCRDSILQVCVQGGDPDAVNLYDSCLIRPTVGASKAAGGGATSGPGLVFRRCEIEGVTDGGDPASGYTAIYSRYAAQRPVGIDGQPFNGLPATYGVNSQGKKVNAWYIDSAARTDSGATAASGVTVVNDPAILAADYGMPLVAGGGIPSDAYVGTVTAKTSFQLVDHNGNSIETTAAVSGITIAQTPRPRTAAATAASGSSAVTCSSIKFFEKGRYLTADSTGGGGTRDYSGNADTLWVGTIESAGGTNGSAEGGAQLLNSTVYPYSSFVTGHVTIEDDPTGGGFGNVLAMAINGSDDPVGDSDNDPRADIESPSLFTNGSDLYCSIRPACPSIPYLVDTSSGDDYGFFNVAEIYGPPYTGSPSIALMVNAFDETANHWVIGVLINGTVYFPWVGPELDGNIHEFTLHVVMSSSASTGMLELWMDGEQQTFCESSNPYNPPGYTASQQLVYQTYGPHSNGGANFLNIQHYRSSPSAGGYSGTITTEHATPMIGTTYDSVQSTSSSGGGVPAGAYVGDVVAGASFTMVDSNGDPLETTGAVSSITMTDWEYPNLLQDYLLTQYSTLGGQTIQAGSFAQVRMKQGSNGQVNAFALECVATGTVDSTGTISGACSIGYSSYYPAGANAGETGPFWMVVNGVAQTVAYTLNSDGSINMASLVSNASGRAVFCTLGGIPHSDGLQMLAGEPLLLDHCGIFDVLACPLFLQPAVSANPVLSYANCRQSYLNGGATHWVDFEWHNGPLNFTPGAMAGGLYQDPADGTWKPYIQNQVLIDSTGVAGTVNAQVQTNINGTRPRFTRIVENKVGPNGKGAYPADLTSGEFIFANLGAPASCDAQILKGVDNQCNNVFSKDGLTLATALTAGAAVSSIHVSAGIGKQLEPLDVIWLVQPQDGSGQSNSRMFVVGPNAVSAGSTTINVMAVEDPDVNEGTFPVIDTTAPNAFTTSTIVYTSFSDFGQMLNNEFDWLAFDQCLAHNTWLAKAPSTYTTGTNKGQLIPGQTTITLSTLPKGYTPAVGHTLIVHSSTPSKTASSTPPTSQTFTVASYNAGTSVVTTNETITFLFEKNCWIDLANYTPMWNGHALSLNQTVLNARIALMNMGSSDARTWPRVWGNVLDKNAPNPGLEMINTNKVNATGYDAKGAYVGN